MMRGEEEDGLRRADGDYETVSGPDFALALLLLSNYFKVTD